MEGFSQDARLYYSKTPFLKRVPVVVPAAVGLVLALFAAHPVWLRILLFVGAEVVGLPILRFLFHVPLERMFGYKEFDDDFEEAP